MRKGLVVLVMVAVGLIAGQAQAQDLMCTGTVLNDVNSTTQPTFCGWIEWFSDLGITAGRSGQCHVDRCILQCGEQAYVREGARVTFARFMRIGLPITLCQLAVAGLYILALSWLAS